MRKFMLFFLVALAAHAQTATISDTLTSAVGGGNWTGRITVSLNAPGSAQPLYSGTTSLAGWSATYCVGVTGGDCTATTAAGAFAALLYTNDAITPAGTSYSARFQPTRGPQWSETWTVSAGDTKLYQIRATTVPTPTTTFTAGQLALAAGRLLYGSASGVATALAPGTNGHVLTLSGGYPVWAAGASGGTWGSITGTLSSQTDLQSALDGKLSTSGNAATATALAANPTDCSAGQYASAIAANGNLTCAQVSFSDLAGTSGVVVGAANLTTAGAVPYVSASGTLQQDADMTFSTASNRLRVNGTISATGTMATESNVPGLYLGSISSTQMHIQAIHPGTSGLEFRLSGFPITFFDIGAGTESGRFAATTQNLLIGTTTESNYKVSIGRSGSTGTLRVRDNTATTGFTRVLFALGAADTADTEIFRIDGTMRFAGTNSTGAGSASLGSNSPAVTNSAPYTWIRAVSSDGSTVFIPAWK